MACRISPLVTSYLTVQSSILLKHHHPPSPGAFQSCVWLHPYTQLLCPVAIRTIGLFLYLPSILTHHYLNSRHFLRILGYSSRLSSSSPAYSTLSHDLQWTIQGRTLTSSMSAVKWITLGISGSRSLLHDPK